jgi:hypothetical protein
LARGHTRAPLKEEDPVPSMQCHECGKIKRCTMVMERDENDRETPVYDCSPCRRELERLERERTS